MNTIGQRLKEIIEKKKLTLLEFSEQVGIQRSSLSHLFSGRNKPSIDLLLKIKHQFPDTDLEWLITGEAMERTDNRTPKKKEFNDSSENSDVTDVNTANVNVDSQGITPSALSQANSDNKNNEIERIVIFYKDGKFIEYNNR